jgi:hypothetical protein
MATFGADVNSVPTETIPSRSIILEISDRRMISGGGINIWTKLTIWSLSLSNGRHGPARLLTWP